MEGAHGSAGPAQLVGRSGLGQGMLGVQECPGLYVAVDLAHAGQTGLDELHRAEDAVPDEPGRLHR